MADIWANSTACHPRATCHIAGCCHRAHSMACHPRATYHIAGCCHCKKKVKERIVLRDSPQNYGTPLVKWDHTVLSATPTGQVGTRFIDPVRMKGWVGELLSWFQSHMPHCRCSHLAKSMSWSCHIAGCNNSIRHTENRFSPYFIFYLFFNAVWTLTSGDFRIVSDTLV